MQVHAGERLTGDTGLRHLRAVLNALPRDSGVSRIHDPDASAWSEVVEMLATIAEVIDVTSWRTVMPHAKKGWKPPKGLHIRRPWEPAVSEAPRNTMGQFRKMLGAKKGAVKVIPRTEEEVNDVATSR